MDIGLLIFVISAVTVFVLLSIVIVLKVLHKRYSSTHYKIIPKQNESPNFHFVVPTHVPKIITVRDYSDDDVVDANVGEIDANMIDPELYKDVAEELKDNSSTTLGRLCFSVRYEIETEQLVVDMVRGDRIQQRKNSRATSAIPYVKVCLLPDKKKKLQTKTRQKTPNPFFNEQFIFPCPLSELKERSLRFTVYDFDRFSRQCAIGRVVFPLDEHYDKILTEEGYEEIWREIEDCVNYEAENSCIGEILVSLQYLPAAKRLTISILKAKGFSMDSSPKKPSVYVKIAMIVGGKSAHVRKTTKKYTFDPAFNESFNFEFSKDALENSSFVLTVINHKDVIGKCFVGPPMYVTGTGLTHWNSMIQSPRNSVAMWHNLS